MSYQVCVANPFSSDADGAQVPDAWSFPTSTSKVMLDFTVMCDDDGNCAFAVLPDPISTINVQNSLINTPTVVGGYTNQGANAASTLNMTNAGIVSAAALQAQYENYRVVGWGVAIRATQAPLNQQGMCYMAAVPQTANRLELPQYGDSNEWMLWHSFPGEDTSGYTSTQIQSIPEAKVFEYSDLATEGGIQFVSKHCTSAALEFRDSYNNVTVSNAWAAGNNQTAYQGIPLLSFTTATQTIVDALPQAVYSPEYINLKGWSSLIFRGTNMAVAGASSNVLTVQVVMHFEGVLPIAQSVGISGFNAGAKMPPVAINHMNEALSRAAALPFFRRIRKRASHGSEFVGRELGRLERGAERGVARVGKAAQIATAFGMMM